MKIGNGKIGANKKGKIDVFVNDQTNPLFQNFLMNELKDDITLTSPALKNAEVVSVSTGHGFTVADGEYITIYENNRWVQSRVVSVDGDDIGLDEPLAFEISTDAIVIRGNNLLNVDGSTDEVEFSFMLRSFTIPIDISKIIILAIHPAEGDYTKFTGITELPNGIWFRKENGVDFNLGNYKNNQDFRLKGATVDFPDKAPAGAFATEIVFDMVDIFGQVMRFYPEDDDTFKGTVRDALQTITSLQVALIGSYTDES